MSASPLASVAIAFPTSLPPNSTASRVRAQARWVRRRGRALILQVTAASRTMMHVRHCSLSPASSDWGTHHHGIPEQRPSRNRDRIAPCGFAPAYVAAHTVRLSRSSCSRCWARDAPAGRDLLGQQRRRSLARCISHTGWWRRRFCCGVLHFWIRPPAAAKLLSDVSRGRLLGRWGAASSHRRFST